MATAPTMADRESFGCGPLSANYDEALAFASEHHRSQKRKASNIPYLSHLLSVSALVLENGGTEDAAIAALLHDAVEDAPDGSGLAVLQEIEERFGQSVAETVLACSDGLNEAGERSGSWSDRKIPYIAALPHKSFDAALVTAADKTHNARCIAADVRRFGAEFWKTFNSCQHQLAWYYAAVRAGIRTQLGDNPIGPILHDAVEELLAAANEPTPGLGAAPAACTCAK